MNTTMIATVNTDTAAPDVRVAEFYRRLGAGDTEGGIALLAEDIEWRTLMGVPWGGHYHSREEVIKSVFGTILSISSVFTPDIERIIEAGDKAVSVGSYVGKTKAGKPFRTPYVSVWQVKDGLGINLDESIESSELPVALR